MRTTVTLDEDVAQEIHRRMRERGSTFKATLNDLLRRGLRARDTVEAYDPPTFRMGVQPGIDLDKALSVAAAMEDDEITRKLELRR
jgi:hypothetical protein